MRLTHGKTYGVELSVELLDGGHGPDHMAMTFTMKYCGEARQDKDENWVEGGIWQVVGGLPFGNRYVIGPKIRSITELVEVG